jgi:hypothetical protein
VFLVECRLFGLGGGIDEDEVMAAFDGLAVDEGVGMFFPGG